MAITMSARVKELIIKKFDIDEIEKTLRLEGYSESKPGAFRRRVHSARYEIAHNYKKPNPPVAIPVKLPTPIKQQSTVKSKPVEQPMPKQPDPIANPLDFPGTIIAIRKLASEIGGIDKFEQIIKICETMPHQAIVQIVALYNTFGKNKTEVALAFLKEIEIATNHS